MRVLTPSKAAECFCPFSGDGALKCIADKCMAWQPYSPNNLIDVVKSGFSFKGDQGFCDYNGFATPVIAGTVGAKYGKNI